jgi:hypothetical protein
MPLRIETDSPTATKELSAQDEPFWELVAKWHRLTPSVKDAVSVLPRGG